MIDKDTFNKEYINGKKAGEILNLSPSRISRLCAGGRFVGAFKNGSSWIIPKVSVENFKRLPPGMKPQAAKRLQDRELIDATLAELQNQESENNERNS